MDRIVHRENLAHDRSPVHLLGGGAGLQGAVAYTCRNRRHSRRAPSSISCAATKETGGTGMAYELVTVAFAGYSIGGVLVALTGKHLIESYGWPSVFFAAILPVVL